MDTNKIGVHTMKEYTKDTAAEYDDMVGYVADDNLPKNLAEFLGEKTEYKPTVKPKNPGSKEFPEQWQTIMVNFRSMEDYRDFMLMIGEKPVPKLKDIVYKAGREEDSGLLTFLGD